MSKLIKFPRVKAMEQILSLSKNVDVTIAKKLQAKYSELLLL